MATTSLTIAELKAKLLAEARDMKARVSKPSTNVIKCNTNQSFELPDGQIFEELECVIIDFATTHEYYDQAFSPSGKKPPACVSLGYDIASLAPIPESPDPQCSSCAVCPHNQWGSNGHGKACKNSRLLALLPPAFDDEDPMMYVLKVTRGSLKFFDGYVQKLATRHKTVPIGVVTRVKLNPNVTWSEQHFEVVRPLEDHEFETYMKRREEAKAVLMTPPDLSGWTPPDGAPRKTVPIKPVAQIQSAKRTWGK